jgi:hypothetical protein
MLILVQISYAEYSPKSRGSLRLEALDMPDNTAGKHNNDGKRDGGKNQLEGKAETTTTPAFQNRIPASLRTKLMALIVRPVDILQVRFAY